MEHNKPKEFFVKSKINKDTEQKFYIPSKSKRLQSKPPNAINPKQNKTHVFGNVCANVPKIASCQKYYDLNIFEADENFNAALFNKEKNYLTTLYVGNEPTEQWLSNYLKMIEGIEPDLILSD